MWEGNILVKDDRVDGSRGMMKEVKGGEREVGLKEGGVGVGMKMGYEG